MKKMVYIVTGFTATLLSLYCMYALFHANTHYDCGIEFNLLIAIPGILSGLLAIGIILHIPKGNKRRRFKRKHRKNTRKHLKI